MSFPFNSSSLQIFHQPTPGAPNSATSIVVVVRFNEWMADNDNAFPDPADGDFEDWFELYNQGSSTINLGGFLLTDHSEITNTIPGGYLLPPCQHLLVWADGEAGQSNGSDLHVDFKLKKAGETLSLYAPDQSLVDRITFGAQLTDRSEGLWPDGAIPIYAMRPSTPADTNKVLAFATIAAPVPSDITLSWFSETGVAYLLESTSNPTNLIWDPITLTTAQTTTTFHTITNTPATPRYYRVRLLE